MGNLKVFVELETGHVATILDLVKREPLEFNREVAWE